MDDDVRRMVADAAGPRPADPNIDSIRSGVHRRRRRRTVTTVAAALLVVAVAVTASLWLRPTEVAVISPDPTGLVAFDPTGDVRADATDVDLTPQQIDDQPTLMLARYDRCEGPVDDDGTTVTTYCGPAGDIILRTGPHRTLEEAGDRVQIGDRTAWFEQRPDGRGQLTLSDRDSMDDTHYQLDLPESVSAETAAAILASIPHIRDATGLSSAGQAPHRSHDAHPVRRASWDSPR